MAELKELVKNVEIKVNGKSYKLNNIDIETVCILEDRYEISISSLGTLISKKPIKVSTEIVYLLLDSKTDFPTLKAFRDGMTFDELPDMQIALTKIMENSFMEKKTEAAKVK